MRRSQTPRILANRRLARRRRRAIPASRPPLRKWGLGIGSRIAGVSAAFISRTATVRGNCTAICRQGIAFQTTARSFIQQSVQHAVAAARESCGRAKGLARRYAHHTLSTFASFFVAAGSAFSRRLGALWAAANKDSRLSPAFDTALFRGAVGLFMFVATLGTGVVIGHLAGPDSNPPVHEVAETRDDQLPSTSEMPERRQTETALPQDADAQFAYLPMGPEERQVPPQSPVGRQLADIDAKNWFDSTARPEPEEPLAVTFSTGPRARVRPDIPQRPAVAGIPIRPEPPVGTRRAPPAWLANAVPAPRPGKRPMIAIVIDDAGVAQERTQRASQLPAPITLAFIPYSQNLKDQTRYARSRGHELLLHIPMEPSSPDIDPGRNALLTSLSQDEIIRRFRWALDRFDGYVGVNNHMGSKFMAHPELVRPVLEEINERGLLFVDSRTDHRTVGSKLAQDMGMPHATRNVFLDNELDADSIRAQLAEVERDARHLGHAIAIGHPHDVTVDVLAEWIPEVRRKGFVLVPISAVVRQEYETQLAAAGTGREADGLLGGAQ